MSLNNWLVYLNNLPSGLTNKSLDLVKSVAKKLDLLCFDAKIITIGGTNGKGSCAIFLESIILNAEYKTGTFISPHLLSYNERIRLNGKNIDDASLIQAFEIIDYFSKKIYNNKKLNTKLSYFEFTLLTALYIFKQQKLDILILEVGLGGRFDAVNILDSDIAIITNISLDHTQILGNTIEAIGYEKTGIMRANKPIIFGDINVPEIIYKQAEKVGAILYFKSQNDNNLSNIINIKLPKTNAETALLAIKLLQYNFNITQNSINNGLEQAFLPGRYQNFTFKNKNVILDVAHNEESAKLLAENLIKNKHKGRTIAVMSQLRDKDTSKITQMLTKIVNKWYIGVLDINRAANFEQLTKGLREIKANNYVLAINIKAAFKQALAECEITDRIVVFGSFYTVAIILEIIKNES